MLSDAIGEEDGELKEHLSPVLNPTDPLADDIHRRQIEHLEEGFVCWKTAFALGHFAELAAETTATKIIFFGDNPYYMPNSIVGRSRLLEMNVDRINFEFKAKQARKKIRRATRPLKKSIKIKQAAFAQSIVRKMPVFRIIKVLNSGGCSRWFQTNNFLI